MYTTHVDSVHTHASKKTTYDASDASDSCETHELAEIHELLTIRAKTGIWRLEKAVYVYINKTQKARRERVESGYMEHGSRGKAARSEPIRRFDTPPHGDREAAYQAQPLRVSAPHVVFPRGTQTLRW